LRKEKKNGYKKEEDRHIIAVPKSFVQYCYEKTEDEEHKKELKKILRKLE